MKLVQTTRQFALADGVLPRKTKLLIALALDAAHGSIEGVASLARQAIQSGATRLEIVETVRVAQYIAGVGAVYVAARGLKDLV